MGAHHTHRRGQHKRQSGFTLIELTVAMTVATGLAIFIMSLNMASTESLRSGFVAQQYRMLGQAVAAYMGRHHAALVALPTDCAKVVLHATLLPTAPDLACQLNGLSGTTVANGLQPTVAELVALNLLEPSFSGLQMLPSRSIMKTASGGDAPSSLAVQITKQCGSTPGCTSGYRLQGLVFNQQPYDFERTTMRAATVRENLTDAFMAMGGGAALALASSSTEAAELAGYKNMFQIANPLQSNRGGVPGVLAMRSEFTSLTGVTSSDSLGAYSQGGQMWDFSGQSLRGLSTLAASSIGADHIRANKLTINGDSDVQQLKAQALSTEKIKLPVADPGQSCAPLE